MHLDLSKAKIREALTGKAAPDLEEAPYPMDPPAHLPPMGMRVAALVETVVPEEEIHPE